VGTSAPRTGGGCILLICIHICHSRTSASGTVHSALVEFVCNIEI